MSSTEGRPGSRGVDGLPQSGQRRRHDCSHSADLTEQGRVSCVRRLLKLDFWENQDDMCSVIVKGKRCDIAQRTAAPPVGCSTTRGTLAVLPETKGLVKEWSRSPVIGLRGHPT